MAGDSPGSIGKRAEDAALRHLLDGGLRLIARNFRCRGGEIDLIMHDADCLVFVEVRYRKSGRFASAAESVDWHKRRKLIRTAAYFLTGRPQFRRRRMRFDVVALDGPSRDRFRLQWLRDAFRLEDG